MYVVLVAYSRTTLKRNSGIAPHAALPHPFGIARALSICIKYGCGTACGLWDHSLVFARYRHVTTPPKACQSRLWGALWGRFGDGVCAAGRRARLDGPFGTIPGASDMPLACFARDARGYGPRGGISRRW